MLKKNTQKKNLKISTNEKWNGYKGYNQILPPVPKLVPIPMPPLQAVPKLMQYQMPQPCPPFVQPPFIQPVTVIMPTYNPFTGISYNPFMVAIKERPDTADNYFSDGETIRHEQPGLANLEPEVFIRDKEFMHLNYPFNLKNFSTPIKEILMKLNATTIKINKGTVVANKPIFIEFENNILKIWNCNYAANQIISNKGNTITDGYMVTSYENDDVKTMNKLEYFSWNLPCDLNFTGPTISLNKVQIIGSQNSVTFERSEIFDTNLSLRCLSSKNKISIPKGIYNNLNITNIQNSIDFNDSVTNYLMIDMEGNEIIDNLSVTKSSNVKLSGGGSINIRKRNNTITQESIFGVGQINWFLE